MMAPVELVAERLLYCGLCLELCFSLDIVSERLLYCGLCLELCACAGVIYGAPVLVTACVGGGWHVAQYTSEGMPVW